MCPLKSECPNNLTTKWPKGNVSNSVSIGANCKFAHTYAELKFAAEKKVIIFFQLIIILFP